MLTRLIDSIDGQVIVGLLTLVVLVVQACIYRLMSNHTMHIERAYVGFGIWLRDGGRHKLSKRLLVTIQLHNFGSTPATIEGFELAYNINPEVPPPSYNNRFHAQDSRIFLVKGGDYVRRDIALDIPLDRWGDVIPHPDIPGDKPNGKLCLFGRVFYCDRFDKRHVAGFGRVFTGTFDAPVDPTVDIRTVPERLEFTNASGYNYDDRSGKRESQERHD